MSSSQPSPRSANLALRPPARLDSNPPSPSISTSNSAARFHAAYASLPSTSRHASQTSISSITSDSSSGGLLGATDVTPSPSSNRAFEALQRELGGPDAARASSDDVPSASRVALSGARDGARLYDEPEQLDTLREAPTARSGEDSSAPYRARANGSGHEGGSGPSSLDSSTGSLVPGTAPDSYSQRGRERRPGERIFPAPLLLKSDRSYSSGGGAGPPPMNSPFFPPTAPLSVPRRPSTSTGTSLGSSGPSSSSSSSTREWARRDGMMNPPPPPSEASSRSALPYQRHRQQQSSTSSLSHGSYLPYNNSFSYEPRQTAASAFASSSSDAQPASASSSARNPTPPSTGLSASTSSTLSPAAAEAPISAQALLLDVLSLRSAASPMSLSQSQGPLSRSTTPLLAAAGHQRIRSAGSSGSAEREPPSSSSSTPARPAEDRSTARAGPVAPYRSGSGPKLDTVDLSHKRIADLPLEVINELRDEVEKLALGYNLIKDLPAHFVQLGTRLKYLNIRVNLLTTFPAVVRPVLSLSPSLYGARLADALSPAAVRHALDRDPRHQPQQDPQVAAEPGHAPQPQGALDPLMLSLSP